MPTTTRTTGSAAMTFLQQHAAKGQIVTGLLYVDPERKTCTPISTPSRRRSTRWASKTLCPGSAALDKINASLR